MTRRDYILIAAVLKANQPIHKKSDPNDIREAWEVWAGLVDAMCAALATNPTFDRERFLTACGVQ